MAIKLAPTFKLIDEVWQLISFRELKKDDIFKSFNTASDDFKNYQLGDSIDFEGLSSWICTDNACPGNIESDGVKIWVVEAVRIK